MTTKEKKLLNIIFELRNEIDIAAGMTSAFGAKDKSIEEVRARYEALMEAYRLAEEAHLQAKKILEE